MISYSIFTGAVGGVVVNLMSIDRLKAYNYYCRMIPLPTVYKTQLDKFILNQTNKQIDHICKG